MTVHRRWLVLLSLSLVLVACPKKQDDKGKVPFGLNTESKTTQPKEETPKKEAAKEAGVKDGGADGGDAGQDAEAPLTPAQLFQERLLRSLRIGKLDEELGSTPLEKVKKVGALPLRGVAPPVALSRLFGVVPYASVGDFVEPPAEASLRVRGPQGGTYSLTTSTLATKESEGLALTSPSGEYTVVEKKVSCDGVRLVIAKSNEIVAGVLAGKPAAKPWIRQSKDSTQCNKVELEPLLFTVLGWTGQGIVFFLDGAFYVQENPLSSESLPRELELGPGLPAPLPDGFASTDGRTVVVPTKLGLLIYASGEDPKLVRDPHITSASQVVFDREGPHLQLYWTHEGALYHVTLPSAFH